MPLLAAADEGHQYFVPMDLSLRDLNFDAAGSVNALALFQHQGVAAIAAPCDFRSLTDQDTPNELLPNATSLNLTSMTWKEYLGITVYHAAGLL